LVLRPSSLRRPFASFRATAQGKLLVLRKRIALLLAFLVLALSGCAGGSTRPVMKIGLAAPFTGFDEVQGYSLLYAVKLALQEANQRGVAGYGVELVALDDRNELATAVQRAREFIVDPDVLGVLGHLDGPAAVAAASEYRQAGLAALTLAPGDDSGPPVFRLFAPDATQAERAAAFATGSLGARRIAILSDAESRPLADLFQAQIRQSGAQVVHQAQIARWQLDFQTEIATLQQAAPDLVFFAGRAAEGGVFLAQARERGLPATFLGSSGCDDPRLLKLAGQAAEGAYCLSLAPDVAQVPTAGDFLARYRAFSPRPLGPYTAPAYDATRVLLAAIERAIRASGRPSRAAVAAELARTRGFGGVAGEVSFDAHGANTAAGVYVYQILGGQTIPVKR
jgi:branched-chain amino acid transport system substrate-binding protein